MHQENAVYNINNLNILKIILQAVFDNLRPVSLDKDSLNEQIQAHRVLVSDIQDHKARVQGVAEKCRGASGAQEMVNTVKLLLKEHLQFGCKMPLKQCTLFN